MAPSAETKGGDDDAPPALLVVEDEPLIRLDLADQLRIAGFGVFEAASPDEAREMLLAGVYVDCVISDLHMPRREDGIAFMRWLGEHFADLPVFIASGVPDTIASAKDHGANIVGAFDKPFSPNKIAEQVARFLATRIQNG